MTQFASQSDSVPRSRAPARTNPGFSTTRDEARDILAACAARPIPLSRPIFIIAGYHSPLFTIRPIESALRRCVADPELIHTISCPFAPSLESAAASALAAISKHTSAPEIDIIGHSLGGIVGRMLLAEPKLPANFPVVHRLFTLATPHCGAIIAPLAPIDRAARQLHRESDFLAALNAQPIPPSTQLICYARLCDWWVGAKNCAPPGHYPFWLDADTFISRLLGHFSITRDERILADIIRRVRNETPLATAATLPPRH